MRTPPSGRAGRARAPAPASRSAPRAARPGRAPRRRGTSRRSRTAEPLGALPDRARTAPRTTGGLRIPPRPPADPLGLWWRTSGLLSCSVEPVLLPRGARTRPTERRRRPGRASAGQDALLLLLELGVGEDAGRPEVAELLEVGEVLRRRPGGRGRRRGRRVLLGRRRVLLRRRGVLLGRRRLSLVLRGPPVRLSP